jgi:hypothetical protein
MLCCRDEDGLLRRRFVWFCSVCAPSELVSEIYSIADKFVSLFLFQKIIKNNCYKPFPFLLGKKKKEQPIAAFGHLRKRKGTLQYS